MHQVIAVLGLNGDGKLEVIVHSLYLRRQTTIYRCELDKIEPYFLSNAEFERHEIDVPKHARSFLEIAVELLGPLKKHFGHGFRPLQEEIVQDALAGRDVFALMPTGGGKSLCFQLPALLRDGLTIVVSPLIALMKDQVDALQASGVAATFLNSALDRDEARARLRGFINGEFRLLYVAPERLMLESFSRRCAKTGTSRSSRSTKRIASANGATISGRNIASWRSCARHLPDVPSHGADRDGHRAGARGHRQATEIARPALLRRQFQSAESDIPGRAKVVALRSTARFPAQPA